jgi:tripartite-type tricarboxylate transporter receptor subunit TctC
MAARAPADGYTWVMVSSSFAITPNLHKSLPYDPVKDFLRCRWWHFIQ